MDYLSIALCIVLPWAAIHIHHLLLKKSSTTAKKLPPGPPTLPILGNILNLSKKPHESAADLAKTYGPLMTLQFGQVTAVIISSGRVAKEVLQKNDASFSNRTLIDAVRAIDHHKNSLIWSPVTPQWKTLRKMCHTHVFSSAKLEESRRIRVRKVKDLMCYVEKCRDDCVVVDVRDAVFNTMFNLLSNIFFSVDLNSEVGCDFKESIRNAMSEMGKPNFGDYFPILRKMDPQGIRRKTGVYFKEMVDVFNSMIEKRLRGERPLGLKEDHRDFLDALLGIDQEKTDEIDPSRIPALLDMFTAGIDSVSSTLEWAMAELLHNPENLKKAKTELNEIVGKGIPVEESHIGHLEYLQAILKETFRLHPSAPFSVPRKPDTDVSISGFTVPKNAQILVNVWAIGRDSNVWERPNVFEPERFIGSSVDVKGCDFELIPFGAGRRICVGFPLAIRVLPLMLGSLVHGFDWELENGVLNEDLDMEEILVFALQMAKPLRARPVPVGC